MLTAAAITHSVNSSREPVFVTCQRIHGNSRRPTMSMNATKPPTWASVMATVSRAPRSLAGALPPSAGASAGSSTSTSTIARSSTTNQPTAMLPSPDSSTPLLSSALSNTTVLATDSERPNTSAAPIDQPHSDAMPAPSAVATTIWTSAPGSATLRTASRSLIEKCRPTPNISSITPISDSCDAISASATKPGVAGPMMMPATR